jgi:uncharacterized protein involved in exopolysaccharide biosynthesis
MKDDHAQNKALFDVWAVFLRYRGKFALPAFLVAIVVLGVSLSLPRRYRAEATFDRRTDLVLTEIMMKGGARTQSNPRAEMVEELTGGQAMDLAIGQVQRDLEVRRIVWDAYDRESVRRDAPRNLTVSYEITSNELDRVNLRFLATDPLIAQLLTNRLVENYIERTRAALDKRLRQSAEFFANEVENGRNKIEQLENQMLTYEIEHGELLPEAPNNVQYILSDVTKQLADARQQSDAATLRLAAIKKQLAETPSTTPSTVKERNPELIRLDNKHRELKEQLASFLGVYKMTDQHPDLITLREQIAAVQNQMAQLDQEVVTQTELTVNPRRAELELMAASAQAERDSRVAQVTALEKQVKSLNDEAGKLFPVRAEYRKLSREVDEAQRQLAFWEDNLRRMQMTLSAESGNRGVQLEFLKPCGALRIPVSPNLGQVLMAALGLALAAGSLRVFMAYRADNTFADPEQLAEYVHLPLFGAVSEIISAGHRRMRRLRTLVLYPVQFTAMTAAILIMVGMLYLELHRPTEFDALKRNPGNFLQEKLRQDDATDTASATKANKIAPQPTPATEPDPRAVQALDPELFLLRPQATLGLAPSDRE